jgi:hypothetical protein
MLAEIVNRQEVPFSSVGPEKANDRVVCTQGATADHSLRLYVPVLAHQESNIRSDLQ